MKKAKFSYGIRRNRQFVVRREFAPGDWTESGFYVTKHGLAGTHRRPDFADVTFVHNNREHRLEISGFVTEKGLMRMANTFILEVIAENP